MKISPNSVNEINVYKKSKNYVFKITVFDEG